MGSNTSFVLKTMAAERTGLFGCCDNPGLCLQGWCCGPCMYGWTEDIMTGNGWVMGCLKLSCCTLCTACCIAPGRRTQWREHLQLEEECFGDCATWILCGGLANCQEYRELVNRNITSNDDWKMNSNAAAAAEGTGPA